MALNHRLPAICVAAFSSIAVLLAAFAGSSCSFLIRISDDEGNIFDNELQDITSSFGVLCEHEVFPRDGDRMWELSRLFLIIGLSLGSLTAALAWAVASFLTPTNSNWNGISILAALTAVIQVPIFVLFEAEPCIGELEDIDLFSNTTTGMGCKLGPGSYLLIASDLFLIAVTVLTQCFDRPRWGLELDLWKVNKKESSKKYKKGKPRNDEYYYDDNENYDDAVGLTSLRAKSIISSEDDDENAFYKISRILPAGHAKKSKEEEDDKEKPKKPVGFFAKLFGSSSSTDGLEVPVGETKSMDDEYDYENQLFHNLEIVRVLPQMEEATESPAPSTVPGEGEEVSLGAFDKVLITQSDDTNTRNVQSFDAVVDDGTKLIPWMPSAEAEGNKIASPLVEQHQMIDSPGTSLLCMETNMQQQPIVSSVTDILNDLRCEEIANDPYQPKATAASEESESHALVSQETKPSQAARSSTPVAAKVVAGVRQLTKKLNSANSKRDSVTSSIRNLGIFKNRKGAYCQMSSGSEDLGSVAQSTDDESGDAYFNYYSETDAKPPPAPAPALQLQYLDEDFNQQAAVDLSALSEGMQQNEVQHIYDALDQDKEGENSIVQNTSGDAFAPFDTISIGSTHSDPGPISFDDAGTDFTSLFNAESTQSSDPSFMDILALQTEFDKAFPNENSLDDDDDDCQENSRGRAIGRNDGRRRRRPISPVGSIKSHTSLLHMTIDEETEEEVKAELDPTYTLKRTLSTPELGRGPRPISRRRDRSTYELLKKLERLKGTMHTDAVQNGSSSELPPLSPRKDDLPPLSPRNDDLPPRSPRKDALSNRPANANSNASTDGSFVSIGDASAEASAILSDLLSADMDPEIMNKSVDLPKHLNMPSEPQDIANPSNSVLSELVANPLPVPTKLETSESESWKELISPMKETPRKEHWRAVHTPEKDLAPKEHWSKPGTPATADFSDETSENGHTRSTISVDSDDSSTSDNEPHFRRTRSKSVGRMKKDKKFNNRASSSLSPSRRKSEGGSCLPSAMLARENRIRRLQQLRKGYVPLDNSYERPESPKPYNRDPYDPLAESDPELTPKRKTVVNYDRDEIMSAAGSIDVPNELFQPSLLDPDEPCPEFDNILDHLDLQLIDLNRPLGVEYGDDEGSM
mmetsp:Transcript_16433/g.41214  ORF Transcript_16433/g.41214 Transcript_16433/m.41214 type:complete len:1150 (-) Transcript_16433:96-3545(-)|eukprot:CAMPEP_0116078414 /NCGR_PEP_ID=MMETSP0327-20121206/591_1 /TAXON_ID=44447 /ORGANISM="Pseudo-nitzschia delicatissima, Strain B596" /LENGTH=1149 /DNA_ID=CAMNT_0003568961 /DNA_START=149 /DNA_END=3598 /DNA_ORIENTATION=-